jgi:hypothetical protein
MMLSHQFYLWLYSQWKKRIFLIRTFSSVCVCVCAWLLFRTVSNLQFNSNSFISRFIFIFSVFNEKNQDDLRSYLIIISKNILLKLKIFSNGQFMLGHRFCKVPFLLIRSLRRTFSESAVNRKFILLELN